MTKVVGIRFKASGKTYFFDPKSFDIKDNDYVVLDTVRGIECGACVKGVHEISSEKITQPLKAVTRIATKQDVAKLEQNQKDEQHAFDVCVEKIIKHKLNMKLIDVEYTFDRNKVLFYFTAESRVDFRELVKELAQLFRTRIELRQIGVRDESKMMGGVGVCGQPFCCSRFLVDFIPVSIKMAKEQGLSLNPTKISGSCGRLMCCLSYEQSAYEHLNSITPPQGSIVKTPDGNGLVVGVNLLRGFVKVRLDKTTENTPKEYSVGDITILKRGTHKKKRSEQATAEKELKALND